MKFLLWSVNGDGLPLADRLQSEGNEVHVYINKPERREQYIGILKQIKHFSEGLRDKDTVVIFDMVDGGRVAESLKRTGFKVFGGGKFNDRIELDRNYGLLTMRRAGIDVGKIHYFDGLRSTMTFIMERLKDDPEERWVFKPLHNLPTTFTYVPPDMHHLAMYVNYLRDNVLPSNTPVILQEFFDGVEVSTELWFAHGRPVWGLVNHTFEIKKLGKGDLGPSTGCMASTVWGILDDDPMARNLFTSKLLRILEQEEYTGPLDINSIVTDDALMPYGLEFTARFGYSAIFAFLEIYKKDLGELIFDVVNGRTDAVLGSGFGHSVRVSVPPYPFEHTDPKINHQIYSTIKGLPVGVIPDFQHVWLLDVNRNKQLEYVAAGTDGAIMEVSGFGDSIEGAHASVKKLLDQLTLPDRQYREDSADRAIEDFPRLKKIKEGMKGAPDKVGYSGPVGPPTG